MEEFGILSELNNVHLLYLVMEPGKVNQPTRDDAGDLLFFDGQSSYITIKEACIEFDKPSLSYQFDNNPGFDFKLVLNGYAPAKTLDDALSTPCFEAAPVEYDKNSKAPWSDKHMGHFFSLQAKYSELFKARKILTIKDMWKRVTDEMLTLANVNLREDQAQVKWKGIKRAYKDFLDHKKKTGRERKTFKYEQECYEAFKNSKDVFPGLVASQQGIVILEKPVPKQPAQCFDEGRDLDEACQDDDKDKEDKLSKEGLNLSNDENAVPNKQSPPVTKKASFASSLERIHQSMEAKAESRKRMHEEKMEVEREKNRLRARKLDILERQLKLK